MYIAKKSHSASVCLSIVAASTISMLPAFCQSNQTLDGATTSALSLLSAGKPNEAEQIMQKALDAARRAGESDLRVSDAMENLARCDETRGRYDRALSQYQMALAIKSRYLASNASLAKTLGNIARVQTIAGSYIDAHRSFTRAMDFVNDSGAADDIRAQIYNDFARYYLALSQLNAAMPLSRDALLCSQNISDKQLMATCFNTAALVAIAQGDVNGAEQQVSNSLMISQADREHYGLTLAESSTILARLNLERNKPDIALPLINNAWAVRVETLGRFHPANAECAYLSGIAKLQQGDLNGAEQFFQQSLALKQSAFGAKNAQSAPDYLALATCSLLHGNIEDAKIFYQKSISLHDSPNQQSVNSAYLGYFSKQLWLSNHVVAAVQFKADRWRQASAIPTWDVDGRLLQSSMQAADVSAKFPQVYSTHNMLLCVAACFLPMLLIAAMLWMPSLFQIPHNNGFEEFLKDAERNKRRPRSTRDPVDSLMPPAPPKSTGKLTLKPQREMRLPERNR